MSQDTSRLHKHPYWDRWADDEGHIYYKDKDDCFNRCKEHISKNGYLLVSVNRVDNRKTWWSHRVVFECFFGLIPNGKEIDHINTQRTDNKITNLRAVTKSENMRNPITVKRNTESKIGRTYRNCGFGPKFFSKYKIKSKENKSLYNKEYNFFKKFGYCSWEKEEM